MKVTLAGPGFAIAALDPAERDLGAATQGSWRWQVTPQEEGPKTLTLSIEVQAEAADGSRTPLRLFTKDADVEVTVTGAQRAGQAVAGAGAAVEATTPLLNNSAKWLVALAAVLSAIAGLRVAWTKLRKPAGVSGT